jgi:hypothetical protein
MKGFAELYHCPGLNHTPSSRRGGDGFRPENAAERSATEERDEGLLEIRFGAGGREIEVRLRDGVDERSDKLRAAHGGAVLRADVTGQAIQEIDLAIEENDGDFRPRFVVDGRTARTPPRARGGNVTRDWCFFISLPKAHQRRLLITVAKKHFKLMQAKFAPSSIWLRSQASFGETSCALTRRPTRGDTPG